MSDKGRGEEKKEGGEGKWNREERKINRGMKRIGSR